MTILFNQQAPEFDPDPALDEPDRAQPVVIDSGGDAFVVIMQQDAANEGMHYILIERQDLEEVIEMLLRS